MALLFGFWDQTFATGSSLQTHDMLGSLTNVMLVLGRAQDDKGLVRDKRVDSKFTDQTYVLLVTGGLDEVKSTGTCKNGWTVNDTEQ